ncbi:putative transmembrane domain protein [Chlamydia ibidis 10-1398/6]|uniref:Transmembrane domain protein n=2 Tax=Chlamydia ibidis TaxID=1405396 RepID=A0ABN0MYQ9_9CHLA|nr:hypothetical protein [Chlamydia ibidis]EQM62424.1 putative transmembrane domain protein [Chlamydia ibidis 10-1398/6]
MEVIVESGPTILQEIEVNIWDEFPIRERSLIILSLVLLLLGVIYISVGVALFQVPLAVLGLCLYTISIGLLLRSVILYNRFASNLLLYGKAGISLIERELLLHRQLSSSSVA